ncbi:MAG: AsmA family protein [Planctomycetota bacterium]
MKGMKAGLIAFLIVDVIIVAVIVLVVVSGSNRGGGVGDALTRYVADRVTSFVNAQLVPELSYGAVSYEAPLTLRLEDAALTAPSGTRVIEFETLVVTLAQVPRLNGPVQIAELNIEGGAIRLTVDPQTGEIEGLSPIVERTPTPEDQAQISEPLRLSNVLRLEKLRVSGLDLVLDLGDGNGPMRLDGLEMDLDITEDTTEGPGWYAFELESGRAPGLELDLGGAMNIDSFDLRIDEGSGELVVGPETIDSLPGAIAGPLRSAEASGDLRIELSGTVPLRDAIGGMRLETRTTLRGFNVSAGEYRVPIDEAELLAQISSGTATISSFDAGLVGGSVSATGAVHLSDPGTPLTLDWGARGLNLERFLRQVEGGPDLAGIVNASGDVRGELAGAPGSLRGRGTMDLRNGRLVAVPIVSQLARAAKVINIGKDPAKRHKADVVFEHVEQGVRLESFEITTALLAARGEGVIGYDSSLDLSANAGPLEKLQSMLGGVGNLIGKVTDSLVTYRITGTFAEPRVGVQPLGVGG